jgi:hypothetical protein
VPLGYRDRVLPAAGRSERSGVDQRTGDAGDVWHAGQADVAGDWQVAEMAAAHERGRVQDAGRRVTLHTGARVAALAAPGEILVSRTIRDLVAGSPGGRQGRAGLRTGDTPV